MPAPDHIEFTAFYDAFAPRLHRYLRRVYAGADHDAAVQDSFAQAFRHWAMVRTLADPWPWLLRVATNVVRNQVRARRGETVALDEAGQIVDLAMQPDAQVLSAERLATLHRAIEALPRRQRQLVMLMLDEDLTAAAAGHRLGMRPATARQQLFRLRRRLRRALGGLCAVPVPWFVLDRWRRMLRRAGAAPSLGAMSVAGLLGASVWVGVPPPRAPAEVVSLRPADDAVAEGAAAPVAGGRGDGFGGADRTRPVPVIGAVRSLRPVGANSSLPVRVTVGHRVPTHPMRPGEHTIVKVTVETPLGPISEEVDGGQDGTAVTCPTVWVIC